MQRLPHPFRPHVARWTSVALAGLALSGCKDVQQRPAVAGPNDVGGTMVIAQPGEPGTLLPPLQGQLIEKQITELLYDRLAEIGDDLNTVGDKGFKKQLAERWEWAPDSLSIGFHLDPRARWHDGQPVRASDVRYSFALMKDPALGSPGLPLISNIDSIAVRDSLTAVAYFKRHTPEQFYDLVYQVFIVPEHIAQIAKDTTRRAISYATLGYAYLALNNVDGKRPGQPHPIFGDRAVRRALSMAVDRRAMLANVFGPYGKPLYGPFPHALSVADTTLPQLPYDTTRARALLDSAGWLPGPDGVRAKNGQRLEFGITTPVSSAARKQYSVLLQAAFKKVGAAARIDETDNAGFLARNGDHGFDTIIELYGTDPSPSGFKQSWTTSGIGKDGANFASYSNAAVDALLDSATVTFDPARPRAYMRRAFETIIEDAPGIRLYEPAMVAGVHKRIHTTTMRADGYWSGMAER